MGTYATEQENFWAGRFGDDYIARNSSSSTFASKACLLAGILKRTQGVGSVLELGANVGLNMRALRMLLPAAELAGVEINQRALEELGKIPGVSAYGGSILEFKPERRYDLVLTSGVMIHLEPSSLGSVYELIHGATNSYVLLIEYYSPQPVTVEYRGHQDRLFKRDFAGELLDRYSDLDLLDYGFVYHRDPVFPLDDLTWFLLRKC